MLTRLQLLIEPSEFEALFNVARTELRTPEAQARYILRRELARLLPAADQTEHKLALAEVANDAK